MVARIIGKVLCFGIEIGEVRYLRRVEIGDQIQLFQRLGERAGDEQNVIALAAARGHLAHDLFIGGMDRHLRLDAGILLEVLQQFLRHVAVPVGDHDLALGESRAADAAHHGCDQRSLGHRSLHETSPCPSHAPADEFGP
jgi:hypothetical protein